MEYPFTVKVIEFNGGETIIPATAVEAKPTDEDAIKKSAKIQSVVIHNEKLGESPHSVEFGRVYVMNELGKTVARYTVE